MFITRLIVTICLLAGLTLEKDSHNTPTSRNSKNPGSHSLSPPTSAGRASVAASASARAAGVLCKSKYCCASRNCGQTCTGNCNSPGGNTRGVATYRPPHGGVATYRPPVATYRPPTAGVVTHYRPPLTYLPPYVIPGHPPFVLPHPAVFPGYPVVALPGYPPVIHPQLGLPVYPPPLVPVVHQPGFLLPAGQGPSDGTVIELEGL